jgi:transposase, IS6 family
MNWSPRRCTPSSSTRTTRSRQTTGRLKARLRPMLGPKRHRSARTLAAGHAFVQNLRRGHYDIATEIPSHHRLRVAFNDLTPAI